MSPTNIIVGVFLFSKFSDIILQLTDPELDPEGKILLWGQQPTLLIKLWWWKFWWEVVGENLYRTGSKKYICKIDNNDT